MNIKSFCIITLMTALLCACGSNKSKESQGEKGGGPQIGQPMMGGAERPEPSPELQALIDVTVPKFKQAIFIDEKNDTLQYNLFTPQNIKEGEKYPIVLFMADASTPGPNPLTPLTQGYGGLVWAPPVAVWSPPAVM